MRQRVRPGKASWSTEGAVLAFAVLLAFGTLAGAAALHALMLPTEALARDSHFVRDGLLMLPLSLVAAWWGLGLAQARALAPTLTAARIAGTFAVLLAPAAAAHTALHAADETGLAHAEGSTAMAASGADQGGHGLVEMLVHGVTDALLALPVAFLLSLVALALIRRRRAGPALHAAPHRRLLVAASTLVVAGAAALVPVSSAVSPDYTKFSQALSIPPVLTGENIDLEMAESDQQLLPGNKTKMWTYNGTFPGPTIRRPAGAPTNVRVTNNLPEGAGSMSLHHHGAQTSESSDGHPSRFLVAPGTSKTYSYPARDNGAPERAAPEWYHDHRDMVTGRNVWMGLAGMFIYDDPFEQGLDLPKGQYDVPLMVTDREFDSGNQLNYQFDASGNLGDVILVNGVPQPFFAVGARRYRFRLYNVSNKRDYTFQLSNGQAMTQIGTESGLLPAPVSRTGIRLGPAERADVVIDFAGHPNEDIVLENGEVGQDARERDVMKFRVNQDVTDDSSPVPAALRPLPATGTPVVTRTWSFDRSPGAWTINGKKFDANRADAQPTLGTTERWVFRNTSFQAHLAHIHLADQKLVSRNGQPPPAYERLKETWYLAPGDEVVVDIKFSDYVGKFIFHCHVLEHEDNSMMTQFQTLPAPPRPKPGTPPPGGGILQPTPSEAVSFKIRILSSKRLKRVLRRGLRFEAGVPAKGSTLRASLTARGRRLGTLRRKALPRGRVRVTLKLSRKGRTTLRRLLAHRRRVRALLKVRTGNTTARARFTLRR